MSSQGDWTPPTTDAGGSSVDGSVPWPGNVFYIIEKTTGKAITILEDTPALLDRKNPNDPRSWWLCVEKDGYYGFQNPSSGRFLGHDGSSGMKTSAMRLNKWELWTPRHYPEGGYQIMSPFYSATLMVLCVAEDGKALARRTHGTTVWEFVRIFKGT